MEVELDNIDYGFMRDKNVIKLTLKYKTRTS